MRFENVQVDVAGKAELSDDWRISQLKGFDHPPPAAPFNPSLSPTENIQSSLYKSCNACRSQF